MSTFADVVDDLNERQLEALEELAKGEKAADIRSALGIGRWAWWNWTTKHPTFREQYLEIRAKRQALAQLEGLDDLDAIRRRLVHLALNAKSEMVQLGACNSYADRMGWVKLSLKTDTTASPEMLAVLGIVKKSGGLDVVTDADLDAHILAAADAIRGRELEGAEE